MNEGIKKFAELLNTDEAFRARLKDAAESYTGEQTEEGFFNNVLSPLSAEYGISVPYEDYKAFSDSLFNQELNSNEIAQLAAGKAGGLAILSCRGVGIGVGGGGGEGSGGGCLGVGGGWGEVGCGGPGVTNDYDLYHKQIF